MFTMALVQNVKRFMTMSSATIKQISSKLFQKIDSKLGLKKTDFTEVYGMSTWSNNGCSGEADWYDEAAGSKLT
jgi:hypothetical protein